MKLEVAVPYNKVRLGDRLVGLDAHFWGRVAVNARLVLLVRPASTLSGEPPPGPIKALKTRVGFAEQIADLKSLRGGMARWASMHARWKLKRLLYPAREPPGGWEYAYASRIVGLLDLDHAEPLGAAWLPVTFDVDARRAVVGGSTDKLYTWLLEKDPEFRRSVAQLARGADS